uniref:Uncharacterized protein n=1 Tax=Phaeomonas parva TaxID=124430 RepID=A0A7S1U0R6_9STRA|mmetsp:Transcript_25606/g.80159  ORF Transcript_25606/g.80159 Transcript_25606/m.80159 type:complete len:122 (+) Transcript_25606:224-589(+)
MAAQAALNREGLAVCPECFMVSLATAVPRGGMCGACNAGATEPEVWSVASSSPSRSSVPGSPAARRPPASAELAAAQSPETPAPRLPVPVSLALTLILILILVLILTLTLTLTLTPSSSSP